MPEENEYRRNDYEENDLFPSGNTPKPLFPQVEPPSVKPLFESSAEPEAASRMPLDQEGPGSVEVSSPVNNASAEAPVIAAVPEETKKSAPVSDPVMTEKAPEPARDEGVRKEPAAARPRYGQVRERMPVVQGGKKEEIKRSLTIDLESASLGTLLKEARIQSGLTVQQAAESSRIKVAYINALEADNFDLLPKGIFPNAYVRALCGLYHLDGEASDHALRKVAENLEKTDTVPAELLQQIDQNVQRNEQEEKRITKIFYMTVFCGGLLLILIAVGIVMAAVSLRKSNAEVQPVVAETSLPKGMERTSPVEIFDTKKLEALTPPQEPRLIQELSVPQK